MQKRNDFFKKHDGEYVLCTLVFGVNDSFFILNSTVKITILYD